MTGAVVGEPEVDSGKTKSSSYNSEKICTFSENRDRRYQKNFLNQLKKNNKYPYKSKIASLTSGALVIKFKELLNFFGLMGIFI